MSRPNSFSSPSSPSHFDYIQHYSSRPASSAISLVAGVVVVYLLLTYFNNDLSAPHRFLWDGIVHLIPQRLLLDPAQRQELHEKGMLLQTHAVKKEALRGMLGMGSSALLSKLPTGASEGIDIMRRASTTMFSRPQLHSDLPPGLGNWDNSCYQNVVLQGLASLTSLRPFLDRFTGESLKEGTTTTLLETVRKLNDAANNGQQLWTPAKLKSMSSWQQQDAQEYYSKILDEIDKETSAAQRAAQTSQLPGLETLADDAKQDQGSTTQEQATQSNKSPLDGLLAQKVTCTRCGFSEGLSMIPFNCITLPLPVGSNVTDVQECLDEYTKLEEISEVECAKCTLLRAEQQLTKMLPANPGFHSTESSPSPPPEVDSATLQLPPELRVQAFKRLAAIQAALEKDHFDDKTLQESCQLNKKARVSTTKTKSACIARPPQCLAMHVNRSVFDEQTGMQRKNYARVQYPLTLDFAPWTLDDAEGAEGQEDESILYRLKAVVTHYGRHENGHYICYRQHPVRRKSLEAIEDDEVEVADEEVLTSEGDPWYRLSDEEVSPVGEDDVLGQGGVFMLFYERESTPRQPLLDVRVPLPETADTIAAGVETTAPDEDAVTVPSDAVQVSSEPDTELLRVTTSSSPPPDLTTPAVTSTGEKSSSKAAVIENEQQHQPDEAAQEPVELWKPDSTSPTLRMRTARIPVVEKEFAGNAFRAVAAT